MVQSTPYPQVHLIAYCVKKGNLQLSYVLEYSKLWKYFKWKKENCKFVSNFQFHFQQTSQVRFLWWRFLCWRNLNCNIPATKYNTLYIYIYNWINFGNSCIILDELTFCNNLSFYLNHWINFSPKRFSMHYIVPILLSILPVFQVLNIPHHIA